ncbi:MAG TPA: Fic family protein [Thermoplasmata archaeon]|nr:Fic family protein [Thermoplasmata archaeon]
MTDLPPGVWGRVQRNLKELTSRRPLAKDVVERLHRQLRLYHTYHSNAIEGNTLTLKETRLVLEQGLTIGGKSLREHLEATNNAQAFDWVWAHAKRGFRFDHAALRDLHELITRGTMESSGTYRREQVWIGGSAHVPPTSSEIVPMLDEMFRQIRSIREPVLRGIFLHHRLAFIHPFVDGNGRTARLAANLVLMSAGYPPVVLRVEDRRRYYAFLEEADRGRNGPFAAFILRAVDEGLVVFLSAADPKRVLVPLKRLAPGSPYSQEYLSLRARQGILEAVKIGRSWYASQHALDSYVGSFGRS